MGTYRKMRAVFLALVILPAAIAYSSGSSSSFASGSSSTSSSTYTSAPTPAPTSTPTSTPTPSPVIQVVKASLRLPGVTVAAFDDSTPGGKKLRTAFKNSVALGLTICGTNGTTQCTGTDVVITGVSRRRGDATVSFYVKTASATAATNGATALNTYVTTGTTFVDNLKSEAQKQGVASAVANVTTPVFTVTPKADTVPVPSPTPTVSGAGKTAVAAGVTVALAGLSMLW